MSKDTPSSGFFSKVVKFVRHPATTWNDLDLAAEGRSDGQGQQALKEMIERKRRNDFVRKREFDMLRKLRARGPAQDMGLGGRPSFFQSSFSSKPDDRAGTLKKIDEIEAQMSMQWWKTKHSDKSNTRQATISDPALGDSHQAYRTTLAQDNLPTMARELLTTQPASDLSRLGPSTVAGPNTARAGTDRLRAPSRPSTLGAPDSMVMPDMGATQPGGLMPNSTFGVSKYYGLDVQELALDPEIEEAAIRYASGDDASAAQGLLDILTRKGAEGTPDEWMALFDLYRATGQVEAFESHAIDFANRFSRSAPQWFSMPQAVAARGSISTARVATGRATWVAPSDLDAHAVTLLAKTLERSPQPWVLDWTSLAGIQPVAAVRLLKLMTDWSGQVADLHFVAPHRLRDFLAAQTPSGQRGVDRIWWDLRMATLRVMDLGDDFEVAALDFCVTYEVSPPGWESPRCRFKPLDSLEAASALSADMAGPGAAPSGQLDLMSTATISFQPPTQAELWGEIVGDPQEQLERLDRLQGDATERVVSCRYLMRVDFSAAGGILNWVSAHHALGREVKFTDVHRLIAAFFHVIGITEHAKVVTRSD